MLRRRKARRQTKEKLAMAVRKHFNGRGIQENDVIVEMLHKVGVERAANASGPHRSSLTVD
jgi:histone deacetylase complex subunit SAP30